MTPHQIQLIRSSWAKVNTIDPVIVGTLFYNRIFEIAPGTENMFRGSIAEQSKKLLVMLGYIINKLDRLEEIIDEVKKLAGRHVQYGVKEEHYAIVGDAFLWTLEKGLGEDWNTELKQAWSDCYSILATAMINAAEYKANAA